MKPIELQNSFIQLNKSNYQQIQFEEILVGFSSDGLLYQTSTNTSYSQQNQQINCQDVPFKPDVRCFNWFKQSANQQYLKTYSLVFSQDSSYLPYLATLFCKQNQLNQNNYFVLCQSTDLKQIFSFFKPKIGFSQSQMLFDSDLKTMIYNSDLDYNKINLLNDSCQQNINVCLEYSLDDNQMNLINSIIKNLKQIELNITQKIKQNILSQESIREFQQDFLFESEGDEYSVIVNKINVIDRNKITSSHYNYQIQCAFLFIDTLSKSEFKSTQYVMSERLKRQNFYLTITFYLILAIVVISSIVLLYYSYLLKILIENPIEQLTNILKQISFEDNKTTLSAQLIFINDGEQNKRTTVDQLFRQSITFGNKQHQLDLEKSFSAKETKILFLSFQNLFKTLNFTLQNYYEQNDQGCSTLLQLNQQVQHFKQYNNIRALGVLYNNMANIHCNNERYIEAMDCYQSSIIFTNYELQVYKENQGQIYSYNRKIKKSIFQRMKKTESQAQDKNLDQTLLNSKEYGKIFQSNLNYLTKRQSKLESSQKKQNRISEMQTDQNSKIYGKSQMSKKQGLSFSEDTKNFSNQQEIQDQTNKNQTSFNQSQYQSHSEKKSPMLSTMYDGTNQTIEKQTQSKQYFTQKIKNKYQLYWKLFHRKFNFLKALIAYSTKLNTHLFLKEGIIAHFDELLEINKKYLNSKIQLSFVVNFYYTNFLALTGEISQSKEKLDTSIKQFIFVTNSYLQLFDVVGNQNQQGLASDSIFQFQGKQFDNSFRNQKLLTLEKNQSVQAENQLASDLQYENNRLSVNYSKHSKNQINLQLKIKSQKKIIEQKPQQQKYQQQSYLDKFQYLYQTLEKYYDLIKQLNSNKNTFLFQSTNQLMNQKSNGSLIKNNQDISNQILFQINSQNSLINSSQYLNLNNLREQSICDRDNTYTFINKNNKIEKSLRLEASQANFFSQKYQQYQQNINTSQNNFVMQRRKQNHSKIIYQLKFLQSIKISELYMEYDLNYLSKFIYTPEIMCGLLMFSQNLILIQEKKFIQSLSLMTDYLEKLKFVQKQVRYYIMQVLFKIGSTIPILKQPILELKVVYDFKITFSVITISTCQNLTFLQKSRNLIDLMMKEILIFDSDQYCLICFDQQFREVICFSSMQRIKQSWDQYQNFINQFLPQSDNYFQNCLKAQNELKSKNQINFSKVNFDLSEQNINNKNELNQKLFNQSYQVSQDNINEYDFQNDTFKNQNQNFKIKLQNVKDSYSPIHNERQQQSKSAYQFIIFEENSNDIIQQYPSRLNDKRDNLQQNLNQFSPTSQNFNYYYDQINQDIIGPKLYKQNLFIQTNEQLLENQLASNQFSNLVNQETSQNLPKNDKNQQKQNIFESYEQYKKDLYSSNSLNKKKKKVEEKRNNIKFHEGVKKAIISLFSYNFQQYYLQKKSLKSKKFVDQDQHISYIQRLMNKQYFVYILQEEVIDCKDKKFELMCEELYSLGIELLILQLNQYQSLKEQNISQHYFKGQIVVRYFYEENKVAEYLYNQREVYKFRQFPLIYEQY